MYISVDAACAHITERFQDFQPMWSDPPTSQTDRRTDDMRSQDRALHYSASHGKKVGLLRKNTSLLPATLGGRLV